LAPEPVCTTIQRNNEGAHPAAFNSLLRNAFEEAIQMRK
jgi:hypothetical protein